MYGTEFATHARTFFDTYAKEHDLKDQASRVATIAANPEQSKHLVWTSGRAAARVRTHGNATASSSLAGDGDAQDL